MTVPVYARPSDAEIAATDAASPGGAACRDDGLVADWSYEPSTPHWRLEVSRALRGTVLRRRAPAHRVIVPAEPAARWTCYFAYLPDGRLEPHHLFTLDRLAAEPGALMVICATPDADRIPAELRERTDALIWKALSGFDFSAYAIALRHLAVNAAGADVFVMNDSVLGPFASPAAALATAPWDLAAFTASSLFENHVQSYAFQLRDLTTDRLSALAPVLPRATAFNRYMDVVICQETRLARYAAQAMSVGALWHADATLILNPSLDRAVVLESRNVPFVKRSLLGRYAERTDRSAIEALLRRHGHPFAEVGA